MGVITVTIKIKTNQVYKTINILPRNNCYLILSLYGAVDLKSKTYGHPQFLFVIIFTWLFALVILLALPKMFGIQLFLTIL